MNYEEWEKSAPTSITSDSLWKMTAYRLAMFVGDIGWHDVTKLMKDQRTVKLSSQLYEALGSISANLAEGYSRGTGKDRARFYEYSLGSARESRDWYDKGRHVLGEVVTQHRLQLLNRIASLLLVMVPDQRGRTLREESEPYLAIADETAFDAPLDSLGLGDLLQNVPAPNGN